MISKIAEKVRVFFFVPLALLSGVVLTLSDSDLEKDVVRKYLPEYKVALFIYILVGIIATYYFDYFSPRKKYNELKKKQWDLLEVAAEASFQKTYHSYGLKFNLMVPVRVITAKIEPVQPNGSVLKRTYLTTVFRTLWKSVNSEMQKKLSFTANQGLCGYTYSQESPEPKIYSPYYPHSKQLEAKFNLSEEQIRLIGELTLVASYNIRELQPDSGSNYKILGVLNVDSKSENVKELFDSEASINELKRNIISLGGMIKKGIDF